MRVQGCEKHIVFFSHTTDPSSDVSRVPRDVFTNRRFPIPLKPYCQRVANVDACPPDWQSRVLLHTRGSGRNSDRPLAMPESRPCACTLHGCLLHGTTVPTRPRLHDTVTRRLRVVVETRCKTRKASKHSRYMRVTALVNLRRSTRQAGKVEHMSRALALVALTHLRYMHNEHPFMLELASSPLVKLPCSPPRTIPAFGRLARKGGCTSSAAGGTVGSSSARCRPSTGCVL